MPRFELITFVTAPPAAVFDLSLNVEAHQSSMKGSGERAVAGVTTGWLQLGDSVTWQARHFGLRFRMTSTITDFERPHRFVDEQTSGPFAVWWHEHRFESTLDGTTRMADSITFRSPWGPLGGIADRFILAGYMRRLIEQRNRWLQQQFTGPR
jgi:ligand-binding SRPBCC domain-containing protein